MGLLHPGSIAFLPSSSDRPQSKPRLSRMADPPELPRFNNARGAVPHSRAHESMQEPKGFLNLEVLSAQCSHSSGLFVPCRVAGELSPNPVTFLTGALNFFLLCLSKLNLAFLHFASTHLFAHQSPGSLSAWTWTLLYGSATSTVCSHVRICVYIYHHTHAQLGASRVLPYRHFWVVSWLFQFQWI